MKKCILTLGFALCGTGTWAEQTGVVGYISFSEEADGARRLQLSSGGVEKIHRHQKSSDFYKCITYTDNETSTSFERTLCLMRLTKDGFASAKDLDPKPEAPIDMARIADGTDRRFDFSFAAGEFEQDPTKVLVWFRGHSADKVYKTMAELDPSNAKDGLYQGRSLSCYKRYTRLQGRGGPMMYRPYLQWCKFLVNKDGTIEPYEVPASVIDEMKQYKERQAEREKASKNLPEKK